MPVPARMIALHNTTKRIGLTLAVAALLLGLVMVTAPGASASEQQGFEVQTVAPAAGGDDDDPFATSDADLAVAVLLPGFFLALTVGLFGWVWSRRETDEDGNE